MAKLPRMLYAVTLNSHTDYIHKPTPKEVIGREGLLSRLVLAEEPDLALMLTYPKLLNSKFAKLSFRLWGLEPGVRHSLTSPEVAEVRYDMPFAVEYREWIGFKSIRLVKGGVITLTNKSPFEDLLDEDENIIARRYLF